MSLFFCDNCDARFLEEDLLIEHVRHIHPPLVERETIGLVTSFEILLWILIAQSVLSSLG